MKRTFIQVVDLLLRIIWYLQWIFAVVLILSSISILADVSWFNVEKIKGFHISFAEIDLGKVMMQDDQIHDVTITNGTGRIHAGGMQYNIILFRIIAAFVELAVWMYIIYLLRKIFVNLKADEFFVKSNGITLRKIAVSVIAISLFLIVFQYTISSYIYHHISIEGVELKRTADLDLRTLLFGIMLFVMAMIFIKGAEIKEEQDLTI